MKQILTFLTILFLITSCRDEKESNIKKIWIPIGKVLENGNYDDTDFQVILTFEEKILRASYFGIENDSIFPYSLSDSNEIISDLWDKARIIELNEDIMKISFMESETIVFRPIEEKKKSKPIEFLYKLLSGREWKISNKTLENRIYSFDLIARESSLLKPEMKNVSSFDKFDIHEGKIYNDFGFWTIKKVSGQILMYIDNVYGIDDYRIFLIEEVSENHISCKSWNMGKEERLILTKVPKFSQSKSKTFTAKLTQSKWHISNYEVVDLSGSSFSNFDYFKTIDSTLLIGLQDFTSKNISYKFNPDNTFFRFIGDSKAYSGNWKILNGGDILMLTETWHGEKNGYVREQFMLVKKLTQDEFEFIKEESIYTGYGSFDQYFVEQKYKNKQ
jgi:hypothetical protein